MSRPLRALVAVASLLLLLPLLPVGVASAADPAEGRVSPSSPNTSWAGSLTANGLAGELAGCAEGICDTYELTIDDEGKAIDVKLEIQMPGSFDDAAVKVYDPDGQLHTSTLELGQADIVLEQPANGTWRIETSSQLQTTPREYEGRAFVLIRPSEYDLSQQPDDTVLYDYDKQAPQASVEVPLRVVALGFEEGELDRETLFSMIPDAQRVGVLQMYEGTQDSPTSGSDLGADTLVHKGRQYFGEEPPSQLLPIEYRWKPELVHAPDAMTRGFFTHLMETSTTGDFAAPQQRAFLERYNTERGTPYRLAASGDPADVVPPGKPIRFFDGPKAEDWLAANSQRHLGFETARTPGVEGYTVYVMNTWDSEAAREILPRGEYHNFLIDRQDPDREEFDGIDWARIWGGTYRFMMVDLGAAPNVYEGETWGNRGRSVNNGSAQYDPPLWEFRAEAPRPTTTEGLTNGGLGEFVTIGESWDDDAFQKVLARTVNEAVNYRFFHAYLYEPRPGTGSFFMSDNVWHDTRTAIQSDLEKLYDQEEALTGLRSLTPYFDFDGDVVFEYLGDPPAGLEEDYAADKAALDASKQGGDDIAGAPHVSMRTTLMMDYLDSKPQRFLRGGPCRTTVPTIQTVVPGHYAWALPVAAGIATNRNGVPWGFLNSVNDATKWSGADSDPTMATIHPQAFQGTFTYTTIHEASHYLGLAHPHDTVGAERNEDGSPRYFSGFSWSFNSTAAPTTYSHVETRYSILDQESIARGHMSYYLQWTDEALASSGIALMDRGTRTLGELTAQQRTLRSRALAASRQAEELFSRFDFVNATFAAQRAWEAASQFRDSAMGLSAGTSALERGTQAGTDKTLSAAGCVQAGGTVRPGAVHDHDDHDHGPAAPLARALPATGGGLGYATYLVLLLSAAAAIALRRRPAS